jgi:DNA repair exonuclease SbcCD ATPase subunit
MGVKLQYHQICDGVITGSDVSFYTIVCYNCGVPFMMPENLRRKFKDTGDSFYCPNGHRQYYSKTTNQDSEEKIQKLKSEHEKKLRELREHENELRELCWKKNHAEVQLNKKSVEAKGLKAKNTRMMNRIRAGVCPCCNRHFENLERHMETKHPNSKKDFDKLKKIHSQVKL